MRRPRTRAALAALVLACALSPVLNQLRPAGAVDHPMDARDIIWTGPAHA